MFPLVAKQERQKLKNVWIFQIRLFLKKKPKLKFVEKILK